MKLAISVPDDVFEEADRLALQMKTSRNHLYCRALKEFLARHAPGEVTNAMNRVCDEVSSKPDPFSKRAARRILERTEW
jgi:hypothetical protein